MTSIIVDETNLMKTIAGNLLDKGCFESLNSFLLETNLPIYDTLPNEFLHLQRMLLQGRWNDVLAFVGPVCDANSKVGQDIKLLIGKQQYLESLSWQGGGIDRWIFPPWRPNIDHTPQMDENIELNTLVALLNSLKPLCTVAEFNSLCLFLTLERLEDHPEYSQWTVSSGRYQCCLQLLKLLLEAFQQPVFSSMIQGKDNLTKLVATAVETVVDRDTQQTFRNDLVSYADNNSKAVHLKTLDTVIALVDKKDRHLQRVTWVNKVKILHRNTSSTNSSIINMKSRPSSARDTGVITRQHVENEFANTVPWPSAGEKLSSLPPPGSSDDDPFASSQEMASPHDQRVSTASSMNINSRPPTTSSSSAAPPRSAEAKRAMSWTVDVADTKDAAVSQGPASDRKSLHNQPSAAHGLSQIHSQSHANQQHSVSRGGSRGHTRDRVNAEHETASTVHTAAVRMSHGKMPGLTSPYTSQDISVPANQSHTHHNNNNNKSSPNKQSSGVRSSREEKPTSTGSSSAKKVALTTRKGVLWDEPCPLRCVSVLDENSMDGTVTIAVGTNAKAVHLLQFRPRDLDVLAEETFRGAAASHTEILDVDGIVQDLTQEVQHIYTFEKVHNGSVYAMDYHRGSSTLITASNDKAVRIIKPNTRQLGTNMKGHTGTIRVVKFAPENNETSASSVLAASAGAGDFKPRLWDIQTESCQRILTEHKATIHGLVWINENVLVTGCEEGVLTAHDIRDRAPMWSYSLAELLRHTPGHEDTVQRSVCALEYVPLLGSAPLSRPAPGAFEPPHLTDVLAIGCLTGSVTFLQTSTTPATVLVDMPAAHAGDVRTLLALPEYLASHRHTPLVFSASYDATASLWACATAQRRIDPVLQCTNRATLRAGHSDKVLSAAALRDTPSIITSGADGRVVLWNLPM